MNKLFLLLAMGLIGLVACEKNQDEEFQELEPGVLYLQMEMQEIPSEVSALTGKLSRERYEPIEFELEISKQSAFAVIHGIVGGEWLLEVHAYNYMGEVIYSGSTEVEVIPNEITPVHLDLTNLGSLEISVSWSGNIQTGDDRFEDNDSMEEATKIYEGEYYHNLYIESGDDDWFEISLSAPHIGVIINYRDHHGDIRMELYSSDGTLLARSKHLHDYSIIDHNGNNHGNLYVRVYSASGEPRNYMIWWQDWYDF